VDNVDNKDLAKKINDLIVIEGYSIKGIARLFKTTEKEIFNIMRNEGFIYDKVEKYFKKEESLAKRIANLESLTKKQQKDIEELRELLSSSNFKKKLVFDKEVLSGEITQKTYKLYSNTAENFKKFCNEHSELKVQEILTIALEDYMRRNKK
jgi:alanyl-tRNA synthetase